MDNKQAIIFGVTGQDGSYLAEYLLGLKYRVIGVTRRCSVDNTINLKAVLPHPQFILVEGDVSDYLSVSGIFKQAGGKPDEVYNLSAQSHVGLSFSQPTASFRINAEGPLNVLSVIQNEGDTSRTRFYQASTSEMFGNNYSEVPLQTYDERGFCDGCVRVKLQYEETPFAPNSPYAIAKLAAHHTVRMFREAYGIHASAGILFNHESPRRGEKFVTRKIAKYVAGLHRYLQGGKEKGKKYLTAYPNLNLGNLDAYRDWGYAPDYVRAMHLMLQQDKPGDYVIGTGETHSIREFCQAAFSCIGISNWQNYVTVAEDCKRPLDVDFLLANPAKAKAKLGWEPSVTFQELVELMVKADLNEVHGC